MENLIFTLINQLQNIGLKVVSTVCDQGPTNQAAVTQLCAETNETKDQFYFNVGELVAILFDVPHLLKNTRNALLKSTFEFRDGKLAKFEYTKKAFELDQKKIYRQLLKLKPEHFKEGDSFYKMKVAVAAAQLSNSMAGSIENFVASGDLCTEYKCGVTDESPHFSLWSHLIEEIPTWKLWQRKFDTKTNAYAWKNVTNYYPFLNGWVINMKSIMFLWSQVKKLGFSYLCC